MQGASLDYERSSDGSQAYVRIVGTIDERFEGKQTASRIKSRSVVVNCAGITLITSFGIRAWLDFVKNFERRKVNLTFVECSPTFVNELNQVVDFAADGRVLSCYAPYVCPNCSTQRSVLLRTDLDGDVIKRRQAPDYTCLVCGGGLEFDEDPASFFPGLEAHVDRSVDAKVLTFLEARLSYETDAHRQLRILKDVQDSATVMVFSGTLDGTLQGEKQAQGLQGNVVADLSSIIHVQQQGLRTFREFLDHATTRAEKLWLVGCPALIIERALEPRDVQAGVQVVSVRLPYHCFQCEGTEFVLTELAGRDGASIRSGQLRNRTCSGCKSESNPMVGVRVLETLRQLPVPDISRGARKAVDKAAKRQAKARKEKQKDAGIGRRPSWLLAAGGIALAGAAIAMVIVATMLFREKDNVAATNPNNVANDRPDWIVSDSPGAAYCVDLGWQLQCVGVSLFSKALEDAERDAYTGALEAFVHTALLNHPSPDIEIQRRAYLQARKDAMSDLEQAHYKEDRRLIQLGQELLQLKHNAVVSILKAQNAPGSPAQRSDSYWEEYAKEGGGATEFLAFVRIDISNAEVKAFVTHYAERVKTKGLELTPMIPTMGWLFELSGNRGYYVAKVDAGPFADIGVKSGDIIISSKETPAELEPSKVLIRRGDRFEDETSAGGAKDDGAKDDGAKDDGAKDDG